MKANVSSGREAEMVQLSPKEQAITDIRQLTPAIFAKKWMQASPLNQDFLDAVNQAGLNPSGYITPERIEKFAHHAAIGFDWVCKRESIVLPDVMFTFYQDAPMAYVEFDDGSPSQISIGVNFLELVSNVWAHPGDWLQQCKTYPHKMTGEMAVECLAVEEAYHFAQCSKYRHLYLEHLSGTENLGNGYFSHPIERDAEINAVRPYLKEVYGLD